MNRYRYIIKLYDGNSISSYFVYAASFEDAYCHAQSLKMMQLEPTENRIEQIQKDESFSVI